MGNGGQEGRLLTLVNNKVSYGVLRYTDNLSYKFLIYSIPNYRKDIIHGKYPRVRPRKPENKISPE